jgi:glycosyltransferase involved in cell wall biosynthesis
LTLDSSWHVRCVAGAVQILWVKAGKLLPVDTGGKIRSFNLLKQLALRHDVTLLSYYGGGYDAAYEQALRVEFPRALPMHTGPMDRSTASRLFDFARRSLSPAPYAVAKFASPHVHRQIVEWDRAGVFDVAICDFLAASLNFPASLGTPTVLFQHNVESMLWQRRADTEAHRLKRLVTIREARKMSRYERETVARFRHVIAVSDVDRRAMATMTDPRAIRVVPTGVDTRAFRPDVRNESPSPELLFLGSMDWEPNIDAVRYFCESIWPAVRARVPEARFRVVGRLPPASVQRLASDTVEIVGRVPSVGEHLHRAAVFVVPLRIGGGTRLKIYEAMGAAKAVVSTTIGAEGLDVEHGSNILLADDPGAFADAVVRLLQNPTERRSLEDGALALAARYDWSAIAGQFEDVLVQAAGLAAVDGSAPRRARAVA